MRILAVCQDYPNPLHKDITGFVHTRNICYQREGHEVEVLSFAARQPYSWDGIQVHNEKDLSSDRISQFDVCVFHAPNLRNALRFLLVHRKHIRRLCLVSHGHEFLNWYNYLPRPFTFDYGLKKRLRRWVQKYYDRLKLRVWSRFFRRLKESSVGVIFVSSAFKAEVEADMRVNFDDIKARVRVINNPIHPAFVENRFQTPVPPKADFVTIRSFDNPKYAVDLVIELARLHPENTFHIYGYGRYFDFVKPPPNVTVIKEKFKQIDLPGVLGQYRCALLPTRQDTQGVLMCEIACLGMPLLSSDLPICKEMVGAYSNVAFFSNADLPTRLEIPQENPHPDKERFSIANTVARELEFFNELPVLESLSWL